MFSKCCGYSKKNELPPVARNETSANLNSTDAGSKDNVSTKPATPVPLEAASPDATVASVGITIDRIDAADVPEPDDDEVFREGVGPPVPLAANLATPYPGKRCPAAGLPRWFSEDDEQETGGTQEPPATPVGKDELALRRHRFFSELMTAAQAANEHRVRFNPLGPVVAGGSESEAAQNYSKITTELESLIVRLEKVTSRLEQSVGVCNNFTVPTEDTMSVAGFQDIINGPFAQYLKLSQEIGEDVFTHSQLVQKAFNAQVQYLILASNSRAPTNQSEQMSLLQPTSEQISAIQNFREKNRSSIFFNHLSAISESITALGWVTVSPAPSPFIKEMNDAGQFYTNRVLKDWKEKDKKHVEWVKSWIQTLSELQQYVKQHHTTGLVWSGKGNSGVPPPPPPGPPSPPICNLDMLNLADASGDDRSALFAQINQGEGITKNLKKVTSDMQTHKNPILRTGPAPFKAPVSSPMAKSLTTMPVDKPPSFTRDGKKWLIEYQKGNHNLLVENVEMNNVIYIFKCTDATVTVKGKLNSIVMDSCKKTSVVFDSLVSSVEFINCQSVQMQVLGKVPTVSIDKTDGCQVYLSKDSMDVEVISSKSSEMNIMVPKSNGDYAEYPIPEQYKTMVLPTGKGLRTDVIENKG